jgi:hypothetical protein
LFTLCLILYYYLLELFSGDESDILSTVVSIDEKDVILFKDTGLLAFWSVYSLMGL